MSVKKTLLFCSAAQGQQKEVSSPGLRNLWNLLQTGVVMAASLGALQKDLTGLRRIKLTVTSRFYHSMNHRQTLNTGCWDTPREEQYHLSVQACQLPLCI